jgi:GcrA cell cycle regulator
MKCTVCGADFDPPWRKDMWSKDREQRLIELASHARSVRDLADALGMTKNAVIGKVRRMRQQGQVIDIGWNMKSEPKSQPAMNARPKPVRLADPEPSPALLPKGRPPESYRFRCEPALVMRGCTLMELDHRTCRWPVGDPGSPGFFFCGNDTGPERSYCPTHHRHAHAK